MASPKPLEEKVHAAREVGRAICAALGDEARKLGLVDSEFVYPEFDEARYSLQRDPSNGEDSLVCDWLDARGERRGQLLLHADGSFWAECDVVRLHPSDHRLFVEAVTAWGRGHSIKSEARLLPVPE